MKPTVYKAKILAIHHCAKGVIKEKINAKSYVKSTQFNAGILKACVRLFEIPNRAG